MNTKLHYLALATSAALLTTAAAHAHVGLSGPNFANATQEITFTAGHGCGVADTYRVKVDIPAGITGVRPKTSDFGPATVVTDGSGNVTSVTWQKPDANLLPSDTNYYMLTIRAKVPNTPFVKLYFPVHQICKNPSTGIESSNEWVGTPTLPDGGSTSPEPAPVMTVLPARVPGWNKFAVPVLIKDMSIFKDALIVWMGTAAYSANPTTDAQLKAEAGVTALTEIAAGSEIWVKY